MNSQDKQFLDDLIQRVKDTGVPETVELSKVGVLIFRNLYTEAKNFYPGILDVVILEKGKSYQVIRK